MIVKISWVAYFLDLEEIVRLAILHTKKEVIFIQDPDLLVLEIVNGNQDDIAKLETIGVVVTKIKEYDRP